MGKLRIEDVFGDEEVEAGLSFKSLHSRIQEQKNPTLPKHILPKHHGFERVVTSSGEKAILAYGKLYSRKLSDLDIELMQIRKYEQKLRKLQGGAKAKEVKENLKNHYKKAATLMSPKYASGWNRWSENILDLFISEKLYKVLWGSGNCGKSAIMGLLLYIKWRVAPLERKIILATRVMKEADARVWSYILEIHTDAPGTRRWSLKASEGKNPGIYSLMYDKKVKKYVKNTRGCIETLPIKPNENIENVGRNMIGQHPKDRLIICFDEAQEMPGSFLESTVVSNWMTNPNKDIYAWGNPSQITYHEEETWDMLFKLGVRKLSLESLKKKAKEADKTGTWGWDDTDVLHLTMKDSPKDDPDEKYYKIKTESGEEIQRLHFLAGKEAITEIEGNAPENSPAYWSQVLGFPFLNIDHSSHNGVISPYMVKQSRLYPLRWLDERQCRYVMGVDPSGSGKNDSTSIAVLKLGLMMDGRQGIDSMNGEGFREIRKAEGEDFIDSIVEQMHQLSLHYKIPLKHIGIETHSVGESLKYAIRTHIERDGKWRKDAAERQEFYTYNPTLGASERPLFKTLGSMISAKDICADSLSEYWVAVRCAILSRQLFNVPDKALKQFYSRQLEGTDSSKKYKIESKRAMKKRGVSSPNDADALTIAVETLRARMGFNYRFYNTSEYRYHYGEEFDRKNEQQMNAQALTRIGGMLGVEDDLRRHLGIKNERRNRIKPIANV